MANFNVSVQLETRPAIYTPTFDSPNRGLKRGTQYKCDAFGCFQYKEDGEDGCSYPYFVCEMANGQCFYADPDHIQFTDKEESIDED